VFAWQLQFFDHKLVVGVNADFGSNLHGVFGDLARREVFGEQIRARAAESA
jgi:hypothetical protein